MPVLSSQRRMEGSVWRSPLAGRPFNQSPAIADFIPLSEVSPKYPSMLWRLARTREWQASAEVSLWHFIRCQATISNLRGGRIGRHSMRHALLAWRPADAIAQDGVDRDQALVERPGLMLRLGRAMPVGVRVVPEIPARSAPRRRFELVDAAANLEDDDQHALAVAILEADLVAAHRPQQLRDLAARLLAARRVRIGDRAAHDARARCARTRGEQAPPDFPRMPARVRAPFCTVVRVRYGFALGKWWATQGSNL